ncbi:hypothetical protein J4221_01335 [Candidatus Pacearchaeota archaeon]|nr:hypothetical protein [Candidatus Pacearchaeota archaeon]
MIEFIKELLELLGVITYDLKKGTTESKKPQVLPASYRDLQKARNGREWKGLQYYPKLYIRYLSDTEKPLFLVDDGELVRLTQETVTGFRIEDRAENGKTAYDIHVDYVQ